MKGFIGNNLISKLLPKEKQYDVRDTTLKGFLIRVTPNGKMSYVCQYSRGRRINIGQVGVLTPAQARDRAKQILSQAVMGVLPETTVDNKLTLKKYLTNEYESWRKSNRKNGKDDLRRLKVNFLNEFGDHLLTAITPMLIEKWRTARINEGIKPITVNRDIHVLKAALSKAIEWELIAEHPLQKLKSLKIDSSPKVRYLSKEEEIRLKQALQTRDNELKAARLRANEWRKERGYECFPDLENSTYPDYLTPMILLSLNTGLRRGELLSLRWENVDFERTVLTVGGDTAKSGRTRHIPLNTAAVQILKNWRLDTMSHRLVFTNTKTGKAFGEIKKAWTSFLKLAQIKSFRWHDMRHHFASKLVMAGVDLNTVRELLGHADITMTLRYAHLAPEHKANAVEKLVDAF
jgi:integrase